MNVPVEKRSCWLAFVVSIYIYLFSIQGPWKEIYVILAISYYRNIYSFIYYTGEGNVCNMSHFILPQYCQIFQGLSLWQLLEGWIDYILSFFSHTLDAALSSQDWNNFPLSNKTSFFPYRLLSGLLWWNFFYKVLYTRKQSHHFGSQDKCE